MTRARQTGIAAAVAALLLGAGYLGYVRLAGDAAHRQWAMLGRYCVDCHNSDDWTADIAFDRLTPESVVEKPELFEKVVRKLRGRMMPPPGGPIPSQETVDSFVTWLESSLDARAVADPNPGAVGIHRLNRTEYGYAIEDLFDVRIDATSLLPKDDESDGFDNVADVLKISPSFLDQYIAAARTVSAMAVGNPAAKFDSRVYYGQSGTDQNKHLEGMPLGTRGGMAVDHYFPVDGEYEFSIGGMVYAGYVLGLQYRFKVFLTIDGAKVFEGEVGGEEDLRAVDQEQAVAVADIRSRFEHIRVPVVAGPHRVGATFGARTFAESDDVLQPFVPGGGEDDIVTADRLQIDGPFGAAGLGETPSRKKIFVCRPETKTDELPCATKILTRIARRAFHRSIGDADLAAPLAFYRDGRESGGDFDAGIRNALLAILTSPKFLYRAEPLPDGLAPGSIYDIDDFELASRLSFFLWSRLPDDELLDLAQRGRLGSPDVLEAQVKRMLADPRSETLVTNFALQWLDLRGLSGIDPDPAVFPQFDKALNTAFQREMDLFLDSILRGNQSVLDLLNADYTFVNERLALHYGIAEVRGDQFRRVELTDPNRWGLFGKGSVLMATSYPNRTAPVLRGAWILESLLGTPPASPPPNIPALPETQDGGEALTVRARLEAHRRDPVCNSCHGVMDGLGFALENFDAIGEWRTKDQDAGEAIDASGTLADGTEVIGPVDLREALLRRPDQFVQAMTEKLLIYALGRGLEYYDMPTVREIVRDAARKGYRFSSIVTGVVDSDAFRMRRIPPHGPQPLRDAALSRGDSLQ